MSGNKRPAGKDFDPPPIQPKQLRAEPPLGPQGAGQQQFVLPVRHPLDTCRLPQGARIIGIPGILPNVTRQPPPSTFSFPSPASVLSPLGLPIRSPLSAGGLAGISPNPPGGLAGISPNPQVTSVPHVRSPRPPHLAIPPFPPGGVASVGSTSHSQTPPPGVVPIDAPYMPPDHVSSTAQLALIRPRSPSVGHPHPPRPLLATNPLAPPPPYPIGHMANVGGPSTEEFLCASPSQFLHSPTSITAISSLPPSFSVEDAASRPTTNPPGKGEGLRLSLPTSSTLAAVPHSHTRAGSKRDHHSVKTKLLKHRKSRLAALKLRYEVQLKEMFFLEGGGNMMDFLQWKRKPNILREQYLKQHDIDADATLSDQLSPKDTLSVPANLKTGAATSKMDSEHPLPEPASSLPSMSELTSHKHAHKSSKASGGSSSRSGHTKLDASSSTRIQIPLSTVSPSLQVVSPLPTPMASTPKSAATPSSPAKSLQISSPSPRPTTRAQLQTQASFSSVYETSHEDIVMRARHEAEVMRAIADLRKEGLWSSSRLPKVQEPPRRRCLWDYMLEEMQWLATDFANERRWKINAAKKLSRSMMRHYMEQSTLAQRSEKEELQRLKKVASSIAKEVKHFWESVRKIVELKHQSLLEEKRKQAMDMHLQFIVDQTQKYSNWLVQGMTGSTPSATPSLAPSLAPSLTPTSLLSEDGSDSMFTPVDESDDEATIDKEERDMEKEGSVDYSHELRQLEAEGEIPIMDLIASLPTEIVELPPPCGEGEREKKEEEKEEEEEGEGERDRKGERDEGESKEKDRESVVMEQEDTPLKRKTRSQAVSAERDTALRASSPKVTTQSCGGEGVSGEGMKEEGVSWEGEGVKGEGVSGEGVKEEGVKGEGVKGEEDEDYEMEKESDEDETTIQEQEMFEGEGAELADHTAELDDLNKENELPLEELLTLYGLQRRSETPTTGLDSKPDTSLGTGSESSDSEAEEEEGEGEEGEGEGEEGEEGGGVEMLVTEGQSVTTEEGFSGVAAAAEQFQPKGITLATTEVKTKVPFLLHGTLREYQHIGLDWLVAMDERRLNGILADEMGLGKTIQTIALLAHLACEKGNWGPHLIIVPTSVMLNWELELKKWCPAFKILTYFGSFKERKQKRVGWSKYNAFHVCVTSYNIAVQDHRAFKQKRWKYLILDEAQNIKNFKSQRWQTLLNFTSQRRLLLTGTPLQNNLMELWSLMHFLMPAVFSSHTDFKEWFSNPLTGMVEGSQEYNESIVVRLHQVLRPFLLRRLKMEVERQMPKKFEHMLRCRLSKRQRFLYEEYMSRSKTKDTLASGNYLSVINILMQLRKVCNHPDLFEPRPIISPFRMMAIQYYTASLVLHAMEYDPFKHVSLDHLNLRLADTEFSVEAFAAFRSSQLQPPRAYLLDPSAALPHTLELSGEGEGSEEGAGGRELKDLILPGLVARQEEWTLGRHKHMHDINSFRCQRQPMYGRDLVQTILSLCWQDAKKPSPTSCPMGAWLWAGSLACQLLQTGVRPECGGRGSLPLSQCLMSYELRAASMENTIKRFSIAIPPATTPPISLLCHHPPPSQVLRQRELESCLEEALPSATSLLHCAATAASLQFPETRLIQYDCGKLQTLDSLLHQLKLGSHRVLIFTQMARMLDVLEIFLNYHGHTYLRLDGSTPPLKRQFLMDRFNRDTRVFCFILSTRSGGLGVNLTGADTVVFYDSDWNPTMDAQAQDRCHRIGQTRDVHIYRLVSERTVEENILKKANQKKLLGDIAIEGGAFTTEFFKKASLRELFKVDRVAMDTAGEEESAQLSQKQIEELLANAEDDTDVQAARRARAEETAEMAEFDETFSSQTTATGEASAAVSGAESQVQSEFALLHEQLSGVEQYAMRYLEAERAHITSQELRLAEENIELAKKDWELTHLQSLRAEEERLAEEEAEDVLLTYDRPETANKRMVDRETGEEMPLWLPPTPPAEEGEEDGYLDPILSLSYNLTATISPALLAATVPFNEDDYDVFGLWRPATQVVEPLKKSHQKSSSKKLKESVNVPPSLFWRRVAADSLPTKLRKLTSHHSKKAKNKDSFTPLLEQHPEGPDWIHHEDWILLKCITSVLEFPLSLTISVPAQIPNWSIVSDLTSCVSKVKRSPLQCREHLMNTVIPREGTSTKGEDSESRKHRSRDGSVKKTKVRKEQRTKSLILADGGKELTNQYSSSFDWILTAASKRNQQAKFAWESLQKHSMHSELLKEYGIVVDIVHSPMHIAQLRAERLQSVIAARPYQGASSYAKVGGPAAGLPTPSDITKLGVAFGLPGNRVVPSSASSLVSRIPLPLSTSLASAASAAGTPVTQKALSVASTTLSSHLPTSTPSLPTSTSLPHTSSTATPSAAPVTSAAKTYSTSDLGKIVPLQRHFSQQQHAQFLLLRQNALQQQQGGSAQLGTTTPNTLSPRLQTPQQALTQKVALPAGIEQLRPAVSPLPLQQRFTAAVTSAANAMRNITSRSLQTEEVLALLKQQSLRMAASQSYRVAHPTQLQPRDSAAIPVSAQMQQQIRPELSKASIVLSTEALAKYQPADSSLLKLELLEQGKAGKTQTQPRVVQVPITAATSVPVATTTAAASPTVSQPTSVPPNPPPASVPPSSLPASPPAQHHAPDPRTSK